MTAIFKREVRSSFHGMIGYVLTAFMLAATAIYFVALNLGYGLTDFGYYTLYRTTFCAAFVYPGAHHALLCRGTPHPHRSAAAYQPGVCVGDRAGQILCPVRHLCTAVPCRCGHDPCTGRTGCHRHGHAGKPGSSAVLLSHGCAAIAIGVFLSSLTENQIIAAVAGVAALLLAYMMPSLRSLFNAGSAVALVVFVGIAGAASLLAGLRTRSFVLGCLAFACAAWG